MSRNPPEYHYIAYIDEAGDPGIKKVKPDDPNGSSEWIVVSAALIPAELEGQVEGWVNDMMKAMNSHQLRDLHFQRLSSDRKLLVCNMLAEKNVRLFTIASNKRNMKGYQNLKAAQIPSQSWFYCWLTRVLLERVTDSVLAASQKRYDAPKFVKLEFSERGGLSYSQMHAYYEWIRMKSANGRVPLYLPWGKVEFDVLHQDLFRVYNHRERAGLKLADIAASAFFKAIDCYDTLDRDASFAKALGRCMAKSPVSGQIGGYGVKLWPSWTKLTKEVGVPPDQLEIFSHFGYPSNYWWQG
jgi:hypothetical protein